MTESENQEQYIEEETATQEVEELEESQEVEEGQEEEQPEEVDRNNPIYLKGKTEAKAEMQKALEKRIGKEVYKRKVMETQFEQKMREFAERFEPILQNQKPEQPPKYENFENEADYYYELQKYNNKRLESDSRKQAPNQKELGKIDQYLEQSFVSKEQVYAKNNPDYMESRTLVSSFISNNPDMINLFHKMGPEMVHYLGDNIEVLEDISSLPALEAGLRLGEITKELKPQPKKVIQKKRPEPTSNLRGAQKGVKNIADLTQRQYNEYMKTI